MGRHEQADGRHRQYPNLLGGVAVEYRGKGEDNEQADAVVK